MDPNSESPSGSVDSSLNVGGIFVSERRCSGRCRSIKGIGDEVAQRRVAFENLDDERNTPTTGSLRSCAGKE